MITLMISMSILIVFRQIDKEIYWRYEYVTCCGIGVGRQDNIDDVS